MEDMDWIVEVLEYIAIVYLIYLGIVVMVNVIQ